jgi:uncharacterized protein YndB with AHSA1/START domain
MADETYEHKGRIIRAEMRTSATPEQAWEGWAHPEKIAGWFVDRAAGEAKAGGTMTWFFDSFGYVLPYHVVDAVPGSVFVLKWDPPDSEALPGILEVRIAREGGETVVRLVNSGFREDAKWNEEYEGVDSGWRMSLALLKHYLEHHFGRAKKSEMIFRPAAFDYARLREYFLEKAKLGQWIAQLPAPAGAAGGIGRVGDVCRVLLRDGGALTGRVLEITKSEVALSWEEIGGTLELKAFSIGPQKMLGVRIMSWTLDADPFERLVGGLEPAVGRLAAIFPAGVAQGSAESERRTSPFKEKP